METSECHLNRTKSQSYAEWKLVLLLWRERLPASRLPFHRWSSDKQHLLRCLRRASTKGRKMEVWLSWIVDDDVAEGEEGGY
jgi:hypothetical protein